MAKLNLSILPTTTIVYPTYYRRDGDVDEHVPGDLPHVLGHAEEAEAAHGPVEGDAGRAHGHGARAHQLQEVASPLLVPRHGLL